MRKMDQDGKLLCDLQADIFEKSIDYPSSSPIFIRRFMNSDYCARMDEKGFVDGSDNLDNVFAILDEQYGPTTYGSTKYSEDELHWIGYIYRYWAYSFQWSSKKVFRMMKGRDMHEIYYAYHSLDPEQVVERILEAKHTGMSAPFNNDKKRINEGVRYLRIIRGGSAV